MNPWDSISLSACLLACLPACTSDTGSVGMQRYSESCSCHAETYLIDGRHLPRHILVRFHEGDVHNLQSQGRSYQEQMREWLQEMVCNTKRAGQYQRNQSRIEETFCNTKKTGRNTGKHISSRCSPEDGPDISHLQRERTKKSHTAICLQFVQTTSVTQPVLHKMCRSLQ